MVSSSFAFVATVDLPSLVIEVAHNYDEAFIFLSKQVLGWHFDIVELYEAGCGGGRVRCLDRLGADAFLFLHK